jgi:hypothetical protein
MYHELGRWCGFINISREALDPDHSSYDEIVISAFNDNNNNNRIYKNENGHMWQLANLSTSDGETFTLHVNDTSFYFIGVKNGKDVPFYGSFIGNKIIFFRH